MEFPYWVQVKGKPLQQKLPMDDTAKGGLTLFRELLPWFLAHPKISNVNITVIWRPLGLKLKMKAL